MSPPLAHAVEKRICFFAKIDNDVVAGCVLTYERWTWSSSALLYSAIQMFSLMPRKEQASQGISLYTVWIPLFAGFGRKNGKKTEDNVLFLSHLNLC